MGLALGTPEAFLRPVNAAMAPIPYSALNPRVYFDLSTAQGDPLGTVIFRLSAQTHPQFAENFCKLSSGAGEHYKGKALSYKGTPLHAICSSGVVAGGDVTFSNGSGGRAGLDSGQNFVDNTSSLPLTVYEN
ncbi:Peptidyl-prolyl cis-trans isomerase A [Aphelenchoides avenae]|nr:Peptidyl-prolyl cis-trans isomerase A [Aphelenchus avenae]